MSSQHEKFMTMAIEEARNALKAGERPFGSVIIREGEVIARGYNVVNSTQDPTAHAEVETIRKAAAKLKNSRLTGCTLYTSCHPCPMCSGATLYAGLEAIVIGATHEAVSRHSGGKYDLKDYSFGRLLELTGLKLEIITGVLQEEAEGVFREFKDWDAASPAAPEPK
ncbi:MAG: nucleoside deaminase [Nitrospinota bacterium]